MQLSMSDRPGVPPSLHVLGPGSWVTGITVVPESSWLPVNSTFKIPMMLHLLHPNPRAFHSTNSELNPKPPLRICLSNLFLDVNAFGNISLCILLASRFHIFVLSFPFIRLHWDLWLLWVGSQRDHEPSGKPIFKFLSSPAGILWKLNIKSYCVNRSFN